MYRGAGDPRTAQPSRDVPVGFSPEATARSVLARLRKLLDAYTPGMPVECARLSESLSVKLADAALERERLFALGWLRWLNDEPAAAEPLLAEALRLTKEQSAGEALAEAAYWSTRVRLLLGRSEALAEYERVIRSLSGSPRAAAWLVDLLGRAGRIDRAEHVWKSVRGHRRVASCAEAPLLEARLLLRRGELTPAERLLLDAMPRSGVVWVERMLLLAWIAATQKQVEKARELVRQASTGPYPGAGLRNWTARIEQQLRGEGRSEGERVPATVRNFVHGQQARREGRKEDAVTAYRAALGIPLAQPFARYALACLGQEDMAALLASQPGLFLAVRCRAWLAAERLRRREISPAEYLDALRHAEAHGYQDTAAEHFRRIAETLQQRQPDPTLVRELAEGPCEDAAGRNAFRAALELAVHRLPDAEARNRLLDWAKRTELPEELRTLVGRQLLRLWLRASEDEKLSAAVARLLPEEPLRMLVSRERQRPVQRTPVADASGSPAVRLWNRALRLDPQSADPQAWRDEVRELRTHPHWKGLAQALLLYEAALRGDTTGVLAILEEVDAWRGLRTPPRFVLSVLEYLVAAHPHHPGWRRGLARWLQLWAPSSLGSHDATLAAQAGLTPLRGDIAKPPAGAPAVPWLLHQAARALSRDDAIEALAFTRRALALDPDLADVTDTNVVREAVPDLERRARAQRLAAAMQREGETIPLGAGVLVDAVDALRETSDGAAVLDALEVGDPATARTRLETLSERPDLPPRLAHHLALLMHRTACVYEEDDDSARADLYWRPAWLCWLRFLTTNNQRNILLDFLLQQHRHRINDLLARDAVDDARRHWNLIRDLPTLAAPIDETLGRELGERVERFREELATEYLLTTREAMRFCAVPEGWRADYEKGLTYLRRLLSLDRDNPRLLSALVEICNDWFLDLYHQNDAATLRGQLDRFTPFALQLARRIDERPADLPARAALSDFWKFRGFLAADREQKAGLYREALRFNPANNNVRDLLAELTSE
jgi:hypothetical protein